MRNLPERQLLLVPIPQDAFCRVIPDERRGGFPAFIWDVFWITPPVFHLLKVDGWTMEPIPDEADRTDERSIVSHERFSLEQPLRYTVQLIGELGGSVELVDGRTVQVPVALLDSYLHGGEKGYGRPGFGKP